MVVKVGKADVVFLNPPLTVEERYDRAIGEVGGNLPPLGMSIMAAYLKEKGFNCMIIDGPVEAELSNEQFFEIIKQANPKILCIAALTFNYFRANQFIEAFRKEFPDVLIILGGPHVTIFWYDIFARKCNFDLGVLGEAEATLLELVEKFKQSNWDRKKFLSDTQQLRKIKGIAWQEEGKAMRTEERELIMDLNSLPFPARELLPQEKYIPLPNSYKKEPVAHIVAIRGCPYHCTFCHEADTQKAFRARSPEKVMQEIKMLRETYGVKEISFWDDTLTQNKNYFNKLLDLMLAEKWDVVWSCYGRVDNVNPELLKKMKQAGCWNIFYGLETGNQDILDTIKKGFKLETVRQAVKWTKQAGIEIRASFMIALPGETPEKAQNTINFAKELDPEYAHFCITAPFPGTQLYSEAEKYGKLNKDFTEFNMWHPVFVPYGYKDEKEVMKMERKAFREFYFRPKYILRRLTKIRNLTDIRRHLKGLKLALGFSFSEKLGS